MDEKELVKKCLQGKREAQHQLYRLFAPKMMGVCYRYASSREEAEDYLQETFIAVFTKLHQYRGEGDLGAWIRRIAVNTSLNNLKKSPPQTDDYYDTADLEQEFTADTNDNELMELIQGLPSGYRTVFNLYAIEGYSHDEIAGMLNIKASTSRSQFARAREILMNKLNSINTVKK